MKEIVEIKNESSEVREKALAYLANLNQNLTNAQREQFLEICVGFGLNPFKREIYAVPFGNNFNIIVGYEVYIKRAERSGMLAGWKCETQKENEELKAVLTIYRKDWQEPFIHEVYMSEYAQNNNMWRTKPRTMIKKVAIAQGFRLAFSCECGGMPYTADELPESKGGWSDSQPQPQKAIEIEPKQIESKEIQKKEVAEVAIIETSAETSVERFKSLLKSKGLQTQEIKAFCKAKGIQSSKKDSFEFYLADESLLDKDLKEYFENNNEAA